MKAIRIKSNWLSESGFRLDASFHLSDGVKTKIKIEKLCPYKLATLKEEASQLYKGNIHKRVYVKSPSHGLMFYSASDLFKTDTETDKYISKKYSPHLKELVLKKDWILITRSGTLGKVLYTTRDHEDKIGTDDLVRICPAENELKRGYLFAFLASKYGYSLLSQAGYGGVVKHIEPHHLEGLKIPILPKIRQTEINDLIKESTVYRVEGNELLKGSISLLEARLRSHFGEVERKMFARTSFKDILTFGKRFDAPYHAGLGRQLYSKIISENHTVLNDISEVFHPILFGKKQIKGTEVKGNALFKSSSLGKLKPETDFWLSLKKIDAYRKLQVKEGWVLISRTGTVGNVVRIGKALNDTFIDDHMIRVKPSLGYEGMIYCYLKSFYGQRLIEFQKYGSVQEVINSDYIGRIPIPSFLLESNLLNEYDQKVKELSLKLDRAYLLEKQAITIVEKEIDSWGR